MALVMGVDSSTQSTKVEVRELDSGEVVAAGRASHPPTQPPRSEQDPDAWWDALRAAIADAGSPEVAAVSVAAQQHGLVLTDAHDHVLRPAKLWNDTEAAPQAARMVEQLGAARWAQLTGSVPTAAFTIAKLAWVAEHEPEVLAKSASFALPHDYLTHRLTGRWVTDRGDASGTGYASATGDGWLREPLEEALGPGPWSEHLPEVLGPTEAAGTVRAAEAAELGLSGTEVLVAPGTGDNMAAALGLGLQAGQVVISLGTSGTVFTVSDSPTADPSGTVAGFADATGRHLPLVCTLNATRVTDAFGRLLGVDDDGLATLADQAPSGAGGLVLIPYLDGERTPNRPDATGTLLGMRSDVSRAQVARASFEGVVCGLLDGLDALVEHAMVDDGPMVAVGGGARSPAYRRSLADLSGRTVVLPDDRELVATGACVQAAAVLGGCSVTEIQEGWRLGRGSAVVPDHGVDGAEVRAAYRAAQRSFGDRTT